MTEAARRYQGDALAVHRIARDMVAFDYPIKPLQAGEGKRRCAMCCWEWARHPIRCRVSLGAERLRYDYEWLGADDAEGGRRLYRIEELAREWNHYHKDAEPIERVEVTCRELANHQFLYYCAHSSGGELV